jgi:uncharacterized protein YbbK (DUF523 family)
MDLAEQAFPGWRLQVGTAPARDSRVKRKRPESRAVSEESGRVRIGVSACLLGQAVRYDGGHKRNRFLIDDFARRVEFVPVCPEVELGLGVPREAISLVLERGQVRLLGNETGRDLTRAMKSFAARRVEALARENLSGYVLKKDSPSCGMARVETRGARGRISRDGRGLFANELIRRFPDLPIEQEDRLADARVRKNFLERALAHSQLRAFFASRWTPARLAAFHRAHKARLAVHSRTARRELDRLVANAGRISAARLRVLYTSAFMCALNGPFESRRNTDRRSR